MNDTIKHLGCILGVFVLYFALIALPTPEGLTFPAQKAIALMVCAVLVWAMELLPLAVSSILFTCLAVVIGLAPLPKALAEFATPPIFFIFAMFCNAIAFQNSGLNRRVVLWTSIRSDGNPRRLLVYLMLATALISSILADIPVPRGAAASGKKRLQTGEKQLRPRAHAGFALGQPDRRCGHPGGQIHERTYPEPVTKYGQGADFLF